MNQNCGHLWALFSRTATRCVTALGLASLCSISISAGERETRAYFEKVRNEPTLLRNFLYHFPKGGDLHNHLDGSIYAENFIAWGAEDGKCVDLARQWLVMPPCDAQAGRPALSEIQFNADIVDPLIDALSVRNYEWGSKSGHDQFFSTFKRFNAAGVGREGDMLAEVTARAARQNIVYLELMQTWGMPDAMGLANQDKGISTDVSYAELAKNVAIEALADATISRLDTIEKRWRDKLACGTEEADAGCDVPVRYLATVLRIFPPEQVLAQTLLAYKLISKDPRYVGLNFVAPEDNPIALRDYRWQMQMIGALAEHFPTAKNGITLHAGEVVMGLVPPEDLGWHIREAIEIAGARRIGHGIDIFYDSQPAQLMAHMAKEKIMVEINITSNDVILGVKGKQHPFHAYRKHQVPMAFSTDDEGVSRIDLSHEYQRAVETFDLSYADLKAHSRNALSYSFLAGDGLLDDSRRDGFVSQCASAKPGLKPPSDQCKTYLDTNEKARWQWDLEARFHRFENNH